MGDHRAGVVEPARSRMHSGDRTERGDQRGRRRAVEHAGEEAAEERETRDADGERGEAQQHGGHDAPAQPARQPPEPEVEIHVGQDRRGGFAVEATWCKRHGDRLGGDRQ